LNNVNTTIYLEIIWRKLAQSLLNIRDTTCTNHKICATKKSGYNKILLG